MALSPGATDEEKVLIFKTLFMLSNNKMKKRKEKEKEKKRDL